MMGGRIPMAGNSMDAFMQGLTQSQSIFDSLMKNKLVGAQAQRESKLAQLPFGGAEVPGPAGQVVGLETLKQTYGENSPQYQTAKNAFDLNQQGNTSRINYQDKLTSTMPLRYTTPQGRSLQEESNVNQGYSPTGTPIGQPILPGQPPYNPNATPNAQGENYELARLKQNVPAPVLQKNLYASNIEKTLDMIDPEELSQYAGIKGGLERKGEETMSAFGHKTDRYKKYLKALDAVDLLNTQVRQFYGDSVQPQMIERLSKITNPSTWLNNPDLAKEIFNTTKDILGKEMNTYRQAIKGTEVYSGGENKNSQQPEGQIQAIKKAGDKEYHKINGKWYPVMGS